MRWGAPETGDVEGYAIYDYFGPGEPTEQVELGRVGPDAFEFELSTLSSQSPRIHVVAFNGSGESAPRRRLRRATRQRGTAAVFAAGR